MSQTRLDEMLTKLREQEYRITPQRLAVLRILADSDGHPGVETIYERVREDFPTTSLATIYKTVAVLKELGQVLEIGLADGGNRYDGKKPHPHPHLICTQCRRIMDPDLESLKHLTAELARESGFRITSHRLDFFGVCPECQSSPTAD